MPYRILVRIPVEPEHPEIYRTRREAKEVLESLELMQPENIYRIVREPAGKNHPCSRGKKG
jgi:hypothetical protein